MKAKLKKHQLPIPALDFLAKHKFTEIRDWVWGTREETYRLYDLQNYAEEAVTSSCEDYVLLGHDGFGTNSWYFHVLVKWKYITVLIQAPWGGAFSNGSVAVQGLKVRFDLLGEFIDVSERLLQQGVKVKGHLVVQQSSRANPRWAWIEEGTPFFWREEFANAMTPALEMLKQKYAEELEREETMVFKV